MVNKLEKNGQIAVLYSPGYGAGWSTWAHDHEEEFLFDPEVAQAILDGNKELAERLAKEKWPDEYFGGLDDLRVEWVPKGTRFYIHEYDGNESVRYLEQIGYTA